MTSAGTVVGPAREPAPVRAPGPGAEPIDGGRPGPRWATAVALAAVPTVGVAADLVATRHGDSIGQDSAAYIGAAHNLLSGRGVTTPFDLSGSTLTPDQVFAFHGAVPLVHFPPLYPVVLAAISSTGVGLDTAARVLGAVVLGLVLLVFELLLRRFTGSALLVPVTGALLLLAGPTAFFHQDLLEVDTSVLSDSLFLLVFLSGVLLTVGLVDRPGRARLVALAGCLAVAPLVRYVGLSLVVAAAMVIWWWCPWPKPTRRWAAGGLAAAGLLPTVAWSWYTADVEHGGAVRSLAWHPPPNALHWLLFIASGWLFPSSVPDRLRQGLFVAVAAAGLLALVVARWRRPDEMRPAVRGELVIAAFATTYVAVVLVTRFALDASTPLDNRILLPLIPLTYLALVSVIVSVVPPVVVGRLVAAGVCLLAAFGAVGGTLTLLQRSAATGGLAGTPTMEALRRLPSNTLIASGVEDLVSTDAGRSSIRVPVRVEGLTGRPNPAFEDQVRQLAFLLARHHGVLVVDPAASSDFVTGGATPADVAGVARLQLVTALPDGGRLYRVGPLLGRSPMAPPIAPTSDPAADAPAPT